jgi:hypothetical protein
MKNYFLLSVKRFSLLLLRHHHYFSVGLKEHKRGQVTGRKEQEGEAKRQGMSNRKKILWLALLSDPKIILD